MTDQINEILCKSSERIAVYLTPEQKQMLDALDRQREERFHDALTQAGK
jgi:Spy/CpxP family protein refolding chaperone